MLTSICDVIQYVNVPQIKQYASAILRNTLEPVLSTFTDVNNKKTKLIHSTSKKEKNDLLEDYVYFAELMLRSYEVSGNEVFKQNLKKRSYDDKNRVLSRRGTLYKNIKKNLSCQILNVIFLTNHINRQWQLC